jgi:hypothetical protein
VPIGRSDRAEERKRQQHERRPPIALQIASPRTPAPPPAARSADVADLPSAMNTGYGRVRLMALEVEIADAEREVHRVGIL